MHLTQRSRERDQALRGSESITAREQILQGRARPKIFHDEDPGLVIGGKKTWCNGTSDPGQELQGACSLWNCSGSLRWWTAGRRTLTMTELGTSPVSVCMVCRVMWGQGDIPNWADQPSVTDSLWTMLTGVPA